MELDLAIEILKQRFSRALPGKEAHMLMAPQNRSLDFPKNVDLKESAVLLLLYKKQGEAHIVFMKRSVYDGVHSGQISFPGGKYEVFDEDLSKTALREANEELGVSEKNVQLIGNLSTLVIPHSKFLVQPYVGYLKYTPAFIPDQKEVDHVIEVPLSYFYQNDIKDEFNFSSIKGSVVAPYYKLKGEKLWGATAMILSELLLMLREE